MNKLSSPNSNKLEAINAIHDWVMPTSGSKMRAITRLEDLLQKKPLSYVRAIWEKQGFTSDLIESLIGSHLRQNSRVMDEPDETNEANA